MSSQARNTSSQASNVSNQAWNTLSQAPYMASGVGLYQVKLGICQAMHLSCYQNGNQMDKV